jgi:hypothetical protein
VGMPNIANTSVYGNRGYHYYLDGLKVNGKRKRLFFTSEAEAKEELKCFSSAAYNLKIGGNQ